jgi:hypothetical protein
MANSREPVVDLDGDGSMIVVISVPEMVCRRDSRGWPSDQ